MPCVDHDVLQVWVKPLNESPVHTPFRVTKPQGTSKLCENSRGEMWHARSGKSLEKLFGRHWRILVCSCDDMPIAPVVGHLTD